MNYKNPYTQAATRGRLEAGIYPFSDGEARKAADAALDAAYEKAAKAIENEDQICFDVAANIGQQFDNVKHMNWFLHAVLNEMIFHERT